MIVIYFLIFFYETREGFAGSGFELEELKTFFENAEFVIGGDLNPPNKRADEMVYADWRNKPIVYKNIMNVDPSTVLFGRLSRWEKWPEYHEQLPVLVFGKYTGINNDPTVTELTNIEGGMSIDKFVEGIKSGENIQNPDENLGDSDYLKPSNSDNEEEKFGSSYPNWYLDNYSSDEGPSSDYLYYEPSESSSYNSGSYQEPPPKPKDRMMRIESGTSRGHSHGYGNGQYMHRIDIGHGGFGNPSRFRDNPDSLAYKYQPAFPSRPGYPSFPGNGPSRFPSRFDDRPASYDPYKDQARFRPTPEDPMFDRYGNIKDPKLRQPKKDPVSEYTIGTPSKPRDPFEGVSSEIEPYVSPDTPFAPSEFEKDLAVESPRKTNFNFAEPTVKPSEKVVPKEETDLPQTKSQEPHTNKKLVKNAPKNIKSPKQPVEWMKLNQKKIKTQAKK